MFARELNSKRSSKPTWEIETMANFTADWSGSESRGGDENSKNPI